MGIVTDWLLKQTYPMQLPCGRTAQLVYTPEGIALSVNLATISARFMTVDEFAGLYRLENNKLVER